MSRRFIAIIEIDANVMEPFAALEFQKWLNSQQMIVSEFGKPRLTHPKCVEVISVDPKMVAYDLRQASDTILGALEKPAEIAEKAKSKKKTTK